ncbi:hypothetical protein HDU96_010473 [Phlyctochytrium bullatum]|nr:hypothetical protein HDU96_010473 [Phlyctochytrium bullatum]
MSAPNTGAPTRKVPPPPVPKPSNLSISSVQSHASVPQRPVTPSGGGPHVDQDDAEPFPLPSKPVAGGSRRTPSEEMRYRPASAEMLVPESELEAQLSKAEGTARSIRDPARLGKPVGRVAGIDDEEDVVDAGLRGSGGGFFALGGLVVLGGRGGARGGATPGSRRKVGGGSQEAAARMRAKSGAAASDASSARGSAKLGRLRGPIIAEEDGEDPMDVGNQRLRAPSALRQEVRVSGGSGGEELGEDEEGPRVGDPAGLFSNETLAASREDVGGSRSEWKTGAIRKTAQLEEGEVEVDPGMIDVVRELQDKAVRKEEVDAAEAARRAYKFKTGIGRKRRSKLYVEFRNWMINDGPTHIFLFLWIVLNILLFFFTYNYYMITPDYRAFRFILGPTLGVARGAAANLNVSCGIILLPVCRNLISLLRNTPLARIVPFDRNIDFHRILGFTICFWTLVHVAAHMFNFRNYARSQNLLVTPETLALLSGPGATGQIMTVSLFLIATSSVSAVRRKQFEQFWLTHHLIVIFFALLMAHGSFCFIKADDPLTQCRGPNSWKYWVGFGSLYGLERLVRGLRARFPTRISKVVQHPSKVVEVQIKKRWWFMRSGQYIFLNCPELSRYEWHPFTLTSAPEEDFLSVHIRVAGDWTTAFANRLGCKWDEGRKPREKKPDGEKPKDGGEKPKEESAKPKEDAPQEEKKDDGPILGKAAEAFLPAVMVDGPYGAASEDVFNYSVSVCIGAGIGVTPFASILKSIWYKIRNPTKEIALEKVYFIWICREKDSFEWFQDLLQALEAYNVDEYINFQFYYTGQMKEEEISNIVLNQKPNCDALTGLRSPTIYGRPNLDAIFQKLNEDHPNVDVGVFFCGPKPLGKNIHRCCNRYTSIDEDGTRFYYNKENF